MRFLKLTIAYDGTGYVGWQVQSNGVSIQQVLESAWKSVTGESRRITASGRTDSGVHALGQVCSIETGSDLPSSRVARALNAHLPPDIRVLSATDAAGNFHAIRDAIGKTYRYCLQHGPGADLFRRNYCWQLHATLDAGLMREGAKFLIGMHDFRSLESAGADRTDAVRTIRALSVNESGSHQGRNIDVEITADGFLYNMVRNIVGTLVVVGRGKRSPTWIQEVLETRDRRAAGPTAPPHGLFLVSVDYATSQAEGHGG